MFGGSNFKPENFVALYPWANRAAMRQIEDMVARRLDAGERLYCYVRPECNPETTLAIPDLVNIYVFDGIKERWYPVPNR